MIPSIHLLCDYTCDANRAILSLILIHFTHAEFHFTWPLAVPLLLPHPRLFFHFSRSLALAHAAPHARTRSAGARESGKRE